MIPEWCPIIFLLGVIACFAGGFNLDGDFGVLVLIVGALLIIASLIGAATQCA